MLGARRGEVGAPRGARNKGSSCQKIPTENNNLHADCTHGVRFGEGASSTQHRSCRLLARFLVSSHPWGLFARGLPPARWGCSSPARETAESLKGPWLEAEGSRGRHRAWSRWRRSNERTKQTDGKGRKERKMKGTRVLKPKFRLSHF